LNLSPLAPDVGRCAARTPPYGTSPHPLPLDRAASQPTGERADDPRPRASSALDAVAIAAFAATCGAIAWRLVPLLAVPGSKAALAVAALLGYLLADLVSGLVHWAGDTWFREDTPLIGRGFIHPFREHHRDPLAITRHGFLEVNGSNCLALLPLLLPTFALGAPGGPGEPPPAALFQAAALLFSLATFATNQFHKWAHQPGPLPAPVRWLQRSSLILSPEHHGAHHRAPHRQAYCVTVGWMNPLLDRLRVFDRLERCVRRGRRALAQVDPTPLGLDISDRTAIS